MIINDEYEPQRNDAVTFTPVAVYISRFGSPIVSLPPLIVLCTINRKGIRMSNTSILKSFGVGLSAVIAMTTIGCTKMIQPDQLSELRALRAREVQLNKSIADNEALKSKLQRELSSRQQETKQCNDRRSFVMAKLSSFPATMGEPLPEAPPPPPEPEKKSKKKK